MVTGCNMDMTLKIGKKMPPSGSPDYALFRITCQKPSNCLSVHYSLFWINGKKSPSVCRPPFPSLMLYSRSLNKKMVKASSLKPCLITKKLPCWCPIVFERFV